MLNEQEGTQWRPDLRRFAYFLDVQKHASSIIKYISESN